MIHVLSVTSMKGSLSKVLKKVPNLYLMSFAQALSSYLRFSKFALARLGSGCRAKVDR